MKISPLSIASRNSDPAEQVFPGEVKWVPLPPQRACSPETPVGGEHGVDLVGNVRDQGAGSGSAAGWWSGARTSSRRVATVCAGERRPPPLPLRARTPLRRPASGQSAGRLPSSACVILQCATQHQSKRFSSLATRRARFGVSRGRAWKAPSSRKRSGRVIGPGSSQPARPAAADRTAIRQCGDYSAHW